MKIMHICLASAFTESTGYQDPLLVKYNAMAGNQVTVVSDCRMYVDGKCVDTKEEDRLLKCGARLVRYKYDKVINKIISGKVRKVRRLSYLLEAEKPDVILFHGLSGWELKNVARYVKKHPNVTLYADNHADYHNSASNFISRYLLHRIFYRSIIRRSLPYIEKIFFITEESRPLILS